MRSADELTGSYFPVFSQVSVVVNCLDHFKSSSSFLSMKFLILVAVSFLPIILADQSITISSDGGYENIVVAIHRSVPENLDIVKNIKALFTSASPFLHNATRGRAYFKNVTIALPSTWSHQNVTEKVRSDPFLNAAIRIDQLSQQFGEDPYTFQPRGCGEPGEYILFSPSFLINLTTTTREKYGDPKFHLVHEWAHLRYGVFDEYGSPGDPLHPLFYLDKERIKINMCGEVKGFPRTTTGKRCNILVENVVSPDCRFIVDEKGQTTQHSLMFMSYVPTINQFCDDGKYFGHNYTAPNKHNTVCGNRSVWEVISSHEDFNVSRPSTAIYPTEFTVIQHSNQTQSRFVLVLDVSGSMKGLRLSAMKKSASLLIKDIIREGDKVAIFSFSGAATKIHDLVVVRGSEDALVNSISRLKAEGWTSIGSGVRAAIQHLRYMEGHTDGAILIVLTDGGENRLPKIPTVLKEVIAAKVIVHTLALGPDASTDLELLSRATKGNSFSIDKLQGDLSIQLGSAFVSSVTSQVPLEQRHVTIYSNDTFTVRKVFTEIRFRVEPTVGNETVITLTTPNPKISLFEQLFDSTGSICSSISSASCKVNIDKDKNIGRTKISVFGTALAGVWILRLNASSEINISCEVRSKPRDVNKQPIRLRTFFQARSGKVPAIFSEVKQGQQPVLRANVIATVARPSGSSVEIQLKDDGIGADTTRDDGVYSAYFTQFAGQGRYAVVAHVSSTNETLLGTRPRGSRGIPIFKPNGFINGTSSTEFDHTEFLRSNDVKEMDEVAGNKLSYNFERYEDAGSFTVDQQTLNVKIPPGRIVDLRVKEASKNDSDYFVTLEWTSPGEQLNTGKVNRTDLFASNSMTFSHAEPLDSSKIISGDLGESEAGTVIRATVNVSDLSLLLTDEEGEFFSVYFRARPYSSNMAGEHSNVAIANFGTYGIEESSPVLPISDVEKESKLVWPTVVGVVLGMLVLGAVVAFLIWFLRRQKKYTYSSVSIFRYKRAPKLDGLIGMSGKIQSTQMTA